MGKKAEVEASYFVAFLSRGQLRWRFFSCVKRSFGLTDDFLQQIRQFCQGPSFFIEILVTIVSLSNTADHMPEHALRVIARHLCSAHQ